MLDAATSGSTLCTTSARRLASAPASPSARSTQNVLAASSAALRWRHLRQRHIEVGGWLTVETELLHVGDDANDLHRRGWLGLDDLHRASDCRHPAPMPAGKRLTDDGDGPAASVIAVEKRPSRENRDAGRREVAKIGRAHV